MYRRQIARGKHVLHEHPRSSRSWKLDCVKQLLLRPNVHVAKCHHSEFGSTTKTKTGKEAPVLKPTRFMSNVIPMLQALSRECPGTHPHQPLTDGRAAKAAFYPLGLLRAILHGMIATRDDERCAHDNAEDAWDCTLTMAIASDHTPSDAPALPDSSIPKVGGVKSRFAMKHPTFAHSMLMNILARPSQNDLPLRLGPGRSRRWPERALRLCI